MTCADCGGPAVWVLDDPGAVAVSVCDRHLPANLRPRAQAGNLTKVAAEPVPVVAVDPDPEPVVSKKSRRKAPDADPESGDEAGPPSPEPSDVPDGPVPV